MMYILVSSFFVFTLCSCAILSRDAGYTRPEHFKSGFVFDLFSNASLGTASYSSPALKINSEESVSVYVSVENRATMEYLLGPILPVIPIFWMDGYKSGFSEGEKLRLRCHVSFSPGRKYLVPIEGNPGNFRSTQGGVKAIEARKALGKDVCVGLTIHAENGPGIRPISGSGEDSIFIFDIDVTKLDSFIFKVPRARLVDGSLIDVNLEGAFKAYDFKRYVLTSPN